LQTDCAADALKIKKMIEEEHIYEFLGAQPYMGEIELDFPLPNSSLSSFY
jgi:hypothetical protein